MIASIKLHQLSSYNANKKQQQQRSNKAQTREKKIELRRPNGIEKSMKNNKI